MAEASYAQIAPHLYCGPIEPSKEPGLGVELNEAVAISHPYNSNELHLQPRQSPL